MKPTPKTNADHRLLPPPNKEIWALPTPPTKEINMETVSAQDTDKSIAPALVFWIKDRIGVAKAPENVERHIAILEHMQELIGAEVDTLRHRPDRV
jgi:hypothetical protein